MLSRTCILVLDHCYDLSILTKYLFLSFTDEPRNSRRTLDEDEVRLDELLDDLALEEAPAEADVEGPAEGAEGSVFAFDPSGMKFV